VDDAPETRFGKGCASQKCTAFCRVRGKGGKCAAFSSVKACQVLTDVLYCLKLIVTKGDIPMSEFDFNDESTMRSGSGARQAKRGSHRGWYFPLTILGLVLVGGLSILMCFLTKDVKDRPLWLMGLIFMVPAGAMFFSAMLLEFGTGVMTPATSRKPQVIVAVVATLLTFMVGCICDAIYLYGGVRNAGVNFVLAVDRGDTIGWDAYEQENSPTRGEEINACAERLLMKMPAYTDVGAFAFQWNMPVNALPIQKAKKAFLEAFPNLLTEGGEYGVSYFNALEHALSMSEAANNNLPTRIILLTGGNEAVYLLDDNGDVHNTIANESAYDAKTLKNEAARQDIVNRLKAAGCTLYVVSPTGTVDDALKQAALATGGLCVSIAEAETMPQFVSIITIDGDMLRATSTPAKILTGVMLLLEGLVMGICISLMLSVSGQKRFQMILSPLMAALSFVMVKFLGTPDSNPVDLWWLWEGLSFLPLGLIFMNGNDTASMKSRAVTGGEWDSVGGFAGGFGADAGFDGGTSASSGLDDWGSASVDSWDVKPSGKKSKGKKAKGNQSSGSDFGW